MISKKIIAILILVVSYLASFSQNSSLQAPALKIDNDTVYVNSDISFPFWLKAGQTIKPITNIKNLSILEFDIDSIGSMRFSKVVSANATQTITVPVTKVWKLEAIGMANPYSSNSSLISSDTSMQSLTGFSNSIQPTIASPKKFTVAGNYVWRVPDNVTRICVEIWGGGGGGGSASTGSTPGGGGGGGAYGYQCFNVTPLSLINIVIGQGGNTNQDGGNSSFGNLLTATGGKKGQEVWGTYTGLGGAGGTCNAYYSYSGYSGANGISMAGSSKGGNSGDNSGLGGYTSTNNLKDGISPGGAGGGSTLISLTGKGADGQVIIYW